MNLKRKPKTKAGRLLWAVRHLLIMEVRFNVLNDLPTDPELKKRIARLTDRIQSRLSREDQERFKQSSLFNQFEVMFLKPRRKTAQRVFVDATTKRRANALVKQRFGNDIKIISRR